MAQNRQQQCSHQKTAAAQRKVAFLEGRKLELEMLAQQPTQEEEPEVEGLPEDALAMAKFVVAERRRRLEDYRKSSAAVRKYRLEAEKCAGLDFGERRYEVVAPAPGIEYRHSPDFADLNQGEAGPGQGDIVVAIGMSQGPRAVFIKCKSGHGWLPIMSPEGVELLEHKGRVGQDGVGGLPPIEENFEPEEDPEMVELRQENEKLSQELNLIKGELEGAADARLKAEAECIDLRDQLTQLAEATQSDAAQAASESESLRAEIRALKLSLIHISEPTRLLSISYAVFCLKKKKNTKQKISNIKILSHQKIKSK
eukprot:TRINITY_DN8716_c0_g1_i3.p1 TRINITY_DN8716_c0_g1~~TRINITY_DN8716_c0_g1_i3.p1  ORF type:complete len:312 (-),score=88.40 TRINITY_DN8716_c0_g1_i3:44-979(-)